MPYHNTQMSVRSTQNTKGNHHSTNHSNHSNKSMISSNAFLQKKHKAVIEKAASDDISDASSNSDDDYVEPINRRKVIEIQPTIQQVQSADKKHRNEKAKGVQMKLNSVNFLIGWKFKGGVTECSICKHCIAGPSPELLHAKQKSGTLDLSAESVVLGKCGHYVHKTCLDKNFSKKDCLCPVDNTNWVLDRYLETGDNTTRNQMAILSKTDGPMKKRHK